MRICNKKPKNFVLATILTSFFTLSSLEAVAWIGYEETTNVMIDILPDETVEIGNDISYYDFKAKSYKNGYVTFTDSSAAGFRVEVDEIETGQKRVFIMDE